VGPSLVRGAISVHAGLGAIAGHGLYTGNWMPGTYPLYYAIEVSEPAASGGAFSEGIVSPGDTVAVRSATEPTASFGAYLRFDRDASRVILVRFAVSFLSVERARHWLDADAGDWDFDRVRREAAERWNEALGAIRIEGATDDQMRIFYTALCRSMTQPRDRTDDMSGFSDGVPVLDDQYTMWDTYRTVWPLMTLIQPSLASRNLRCLLEIHRRFGRVGTAFIWGRSHAVTRQGGTEVDNVIGDAFVKGVRSDDWCALYDVMRHNAEYARPFSYLARGYVAFPGVANSASATLAFALNDFSVSQIARALGRTDEHARYAARSANWANVWSDAALSDGFAGFAAPRDALGVFHGDPTSTAGFYEDNGWTYSFFVPHDVHGMITRMGGSSRFVDRLRHAISAERVSFLNEPAFLLPWLYVYAGRPDLASEEVRRLVETYTLDAYPAQEDGGAVASRHVFAACGLFPNAGQPIYLLHGPLFPHITIALEDGNSLVIEGTGAGPDNPYVQSATLNGEPLDRAWILHGEIARGGRLTFAMGPTPSTWGTEVLPPCPVFANPVNDPICGEAPPMPGLPVVDVAPNPFRIETVFRVGVADSRHPVLLTIHDARGRRVRELLRGSLSPPVETVAWDGRDDRGRAVSPGVYFYALRQDGAFRTGRVVLSR
jgi:predicted alpha-1,2-mannosidase